MELPRRQSGPGSSSFVIQGGACAMRSILLPEPGDANGFPLSLLFGRSYTG